MGAIKNDIFIFGLGGLTRTAIVNYYREQNGGLGGDLTSLYIIVMPCFIINMDTDLIWHY